jgi:hypothetical protein
MVFSMLKMWSAHVLASKGNRILSSTVAPCRSFAPRSRFIAECDLDAFELVGGHFSCEAENGTARRHVINIDLKTRMLEM